MTLTALAWAAVAAYGLWRFAQVAERVGMAFVERLADFAPQSPDFEPPKPPPIPDDLTALAFSQSEAWAKEDVLKAIREKYEEYADWNKVRVAFGVARVAE